MTRARALVTALSAAAFLPFIRETSRIWPQPDAQPPPEGPAPDLSLGRGLPGQV